MTGGLPPRPRITDAQVHLNMLGNAPGSPLYLPQGVPLGLAAMDAVGVQRVIIDEWWGWGEPRGVKPGSPIGDGAWRHHSPMGLEAACAYPDRFKYVNWVDHRDPDLDGLFRSIAANPYVSHARIVAHTRMGNIDDLVHGGFDPVFEAAAEHDVPVGLAITGLDGDDRFAAIQGYAERHPNAKIVLDHCGVCPLTAVARAQEIGVMAMLAPTFDLGRYGNVYLKWSHAPSFSRQGYPFADVIEPLRTAIAAFGANHLLWGSDATISTRGSANWAEALFYILHAADIDDTERAWLLDGTATRLFKWSDGEEKQ